MGAMRATILYATVLTLFAFRSAEVEAAEVVGTSTTGVAVTGTVSGTGTAGVKGVSTISGAPGVTGTSPGTGVSGTTSGNSSDAVFGLVNSTTSVSPFAGVHGQSKGQGPGVFGENLGNGTGVFGSGNGIGVAGYGNGIGVGVYGASSGSSLGNDGVLGELTGTTSGFPNAAVHGRTLSFSPGVFGESNGTGVYGQVGGGNSQAVGVYGVNQGAFGYAIFGNNLGGGVAIQGQSNGTSIIGSSTGSQGPFASGVYGVQSSTTTMGYGVAGRVFKADSQAIYGENTAGGTAGYFHGDVTVTGTLSKGAGSFMIDHPLDPANKVLRHSFVESPDMMNVYNGIAVLDAKGEACVELPKYFEALNRDFRYQLTNVGAYAPTFVAEEVQKNHFKISGGKPGMKVSWQVTGIRKDVYAEDHRIVVEEVKKPDQRGKLYYSRDPHAERIGVMGDPVVPASKVRVAERTSPPRP